MQFQFTLSHTNKKLKFIYSTLHFALIVLSIIYNFLKIHALKIKTYIKNT